MSDAPFLKNAERAPAEALYDRLFAAASRTADARLYVLVDPTIEDPLAVAKNRASAVALPLDRRKFLPEQCPYVLELGEFGRDDAIGLCIDAVCGDAGSARAHHSICGWIASRAEPDELARHLARMSRCLVPNRADGATLRHWDPRVAELLVEVLSKDQQRQWLAPVLAYWRPGRVCGDLIVQYETQAADRPSSAAISGPLALSHQQCAVLDRAGWVNQTLDALADAGHDMNEPKLRERADGLVARAQERWGLETDTDIVDYALHGLLVHPHFDQHPDIQPAMTAAQTSGMAAVAALNGFTEEHWNRVRQWRGAPAEAEYIEVRDGGAF